MGLELDEFLYSKVLKYFKKRRLNNAEILSCQASLSDIKPRLTLLARAICAAPVEIFPAEREGGYKDHNFFLPAHCSLFRSKEENLRFYIFRTVYLCIQQQLNLKWQDETYTSEQSLQKAKKRPRWY